MATLPSMKFNIVDSAVVRTDCQILPSQLSTREGWQYAMEVGTRNFWPIKSDDIELSAWSSPEKQTIWYNLTYSLTFISSFVGFLSSYRRGWPGPSFNAKEIYDR
jgi:hypothetical protein